MRVCLIELVSRSFVSKLSSTRHLLLELEGRCQARARARCLRMRCSVHALIPICNSGFQGHDRQGP